MIPTRQIVIHLFFVTVLATLSPGPQHAIAQVTDRASDILIVSLSDEHIAADPGSILTLLYRVSNQSDDSASVSLEFGPPSGWTVSSVSTDLILGPATGSLVFVNVRAPRVTETGSYTFSVKAGTDAGAETESRAENRIFIRAVRALSVRLYAGEEYVPAGTRFDIRAEVTNESNSLERIALNPLGASVDKVRVEDRFLSLNPFESRDVVIHVQSDRAVRTKISQVVRVEARFRDGEPLSKSSSARVWILPRFDSSADKSAPIPMTVSFQRVGDEVSSNPQIGIQGHTDALDGQLALQMLYSGVDRVPMLGTRDFFRLSYTNPAGQLFVGDHIQPISPMTSAGMLGRGIGGHISQGRFSFQGTALKTRYLFPQQSLVGGSLGYQLTDAANLSLNMVSRTGLYEGEIVTARSRVFLSRMNHEIDAECGLDSGGSYTSPSCSVQLLGSTDHLGYQAHLIKTSDSYPGSLENLLERNLAISYRLDNGFRVSGAAREQTRSFSKGFSRNRRQYRLGLGFGSRLGGAILNTDTQFSYSDLYYLSTVGALDRVEKTIRSSTAIQFRKTSLHASLEFGRASSISELYDGPILKSRVSASGQLIRGIILSLSGEYNSGNLINVPDPSTRKTLGGRIVWSLGSATQLSGGVFASNSTGIIKSDYRSYNAQFTHRLAFGHLISIQMQQSIIEGLRGSRATDYIFSYSVPIGVPDPRRQPSSPSIKGRVYDAETNMGLEGVVLFFGDTVTVSGPDGKFKIPIPSFGIRYLRLDQKSIGYDRVPYIEMPIRIDSKTDTPFPIDIPIVRAASVSGTISLWDREEASRLLGQPESSAVKVAPMRGVLIELKSEHHIYRVKSDRSGVFSFKNIHAGSYAVSFSSASMPSNHVIQGDATQITVGPGEHIATDYRALPAHRVIKLLEKSKISTTLAAPGSTR